MKFSIVVLMLLSILFPLTADAENLLTFDPNRIYREANEANRAALEYEIRKKQLEALHENQTEQNAANHYLSGISENQVLSVSRGEDRVAYWPNQMNAILRDPQFAQLPPTTRGKILNQVLAWVRMDIQSMLQLGNTQGAQRLAERTGLLSSSNQKGMRK